jgi:hypothetical protein
MGRGVGGGGDELRLDNVCIGARGWDLWRGVWGCVVGTLFVSLEAAEPDPLSDGL